jgi:hypothetical protein
MQIAARMRSSICTAQIERDGGKSFYGKCFCAE